MRATNFSFLNDPSELQYGRELAEEVLSEGRKLVSKNYRVFFERVLERFNVELVSEVYVCCFTKLEDDLSQWRAYGSSAVERYSIGFDAEVLQATGFKRDNVRFARVLYNQDEQLKRLEFVVQRAVKFLEEERPNTAEMQELGVFAARHIARLLPLLKNPAYAREEEWRIILWQESDAISPAFDTSRGVLRPFLAFDLPSPPPLLEVYVMAPARREVALKAATMLLRSAKLADTAVHHSAIPFAE